jgi:hypothetical protein
MCFAVLVTREQLDILRSGKTAASRNAHRASILPVLKPVAVHKNADSVRKVIGSDGKETKEVEYSELVLTGGQRLIGVTSHGNVEITNMGPESATIEVTQPDGTMLKKQIAAGVQETGFFEGVFFLCYLPAEGDHPARVRICFDRQVLSNFCKLWAKKLRVEGLEEDMELLLDFVSVEALFQIFKILLSGDIAALKEAMDKLKPAEIKKVGNNAKDVPPSWFDGVDGEESLRCKVMRFAQAWAPTCPARFELLLRLISIVEELGVSLDNVDVHEYNDDRLYGTDSLSSNIRPLFSHDWKPKGGDFVGIVMSDVLKKVHELKTHEAYTLWFDTNHGPIFKLKEEDPAPTLGARTSSEAGFSVPQARTPSRA